MRYWLFYAGPENYLAALGERDFAVGEFLWSADPQVQSGDLALLYRRALSKWSADQMVEVTGMTREVAEELKRRRIGSDIPVLWQVTSGDQGPFGNWQSGCLVRQITTIRPPLALAELKANPRLRRWQDLRWNFQAQGRDALEIPDSAWTTLKDVISQRLGHPFEQLDFSLS